MSFSAEDPANGRSDEPDTVSIGSIGPIPIIEYDDPRFDVQRAAGRQAAAVADALHSPEDLQKGLLNVDPDVRWRVVPRLVARGREHVGTIPALLRTLATDGSARVRCAVAENLYWFDDDRVVAALKIALKDDDEETREAARDSLDYLAAGWIKD